MRSITGLFILTAFVVLISCSGNDKDDSKVTPANQKNALNSKATSNKQIEHKTEENSNADSTDIYSNDKEIENRPPKIKSIKIETITSNPRDGFRADIVSEDPDGDEVGYIYQWKLNDEEIFGATEDTLEWHDDFHKGDKITIEVIPYDDNAEGVWKSEGSITIPDSPPVITSTPENAVTGNSFNYEVKANDPDGDPLTFSLKNAPQGMSIDPSSGSIDWEFTDNDAGDYSMEIIVKDPDGAYAVQNVSFSIKKPNEK